MKTMMAWTSAVVISLTVIGATPAKAVCVFGFGNCGSSDESGKPSEEEGKQALIGALRGKLEPPYTVESFQKTNGRQGPTAGLYEIQFLAIIKYPGDGLRCSRAVCDLSGYGVEVDKTDKTVTLTGWIKLQKTERGWMGA
jgi:hypothetical protein